VVVAVVVVALLLVMLATRALDVTTPWEGAAGTTELTIPSTSLPRLLE